MFDYDRQPDPEEECRYCDNADTDHLCKWCAEEEKTMLFHEKG